MTIVRLNPPDAAAISLAGLAAAFGPWGGRDRFAWCFDRVVAGQMADVMILEVEGTPAAGSGLSYRDLQLPDGRHMRAAIMTGSWTLPQMRRRGLFKRIIMESLSLASARNASVLTAFVTDENASCRALIDAGAQALPGYYLVASPSALAVRTPSRLRPLAITAERVEDLWRQRAERRRPSIHVGYGTIGDFRSQFIDRPGGTYLFEDAAGGRYLFEYATRSDNLLLGLAGPGSPEPDAAALMAACAHAHTRGRDLFCYTATAGVAARAQALGFAVKPGRVMALSTGSSKELSRGPWTIDHGDRM